MISGKTKIFGIFGDPVEHTFSPGMHNAAFEKLSMDACYVPFAVRPSDLAKAVRSIVPLGISGLNITVPHKEKIIPYLDSLSEEARLIGAVNTIEVRDKELIGHNTDGRGFIRALKNDAKFNPANKAFLLVGSGGAARAVGFSLALAGARTLFLHDLDTAKSRALARDIRSRTGIDTSVVPHDKLDRYAGEADCLINATPLGLRKADPMPINKNWISKDHLVCDLVYNPFITSLLKAARLRSARIHSGIGMLLYQGVIAFEIWTSAKAPVAVMKEALTRQIKERSHHR